MRHIAGIFIFSILILGTSCEQFDLNVYQTNKHKKIPEVTTAYNLNRLLSLPYKDTLHVVFFGDTQRYYDDLAELVDVINNLPKVDAVFITGDLVDFALSREYDWLNEELKKLKVPFLTVIGNHDCIAKGIELYTEIYGPINYSFTWNGIRFIMHNTNSREFNFNGSVPDINWMRQQLADTATYQNSLFVSHIPPGNVDFDLALESEYTQLIREAKNTIFSTNGHRHHYQLGQPYNDGIWYMNTSSPTNRIYSYVSLYPGSTGKKFDCTPVPF